MRIKEFVADMASQIFTFLALFTGWLVLTGSAKTVIGYATIAATSGWILSFSVRNPKEEDND